MCTPNRVDLRGRRTRPPRSPHGTSVDLHTRTIMLETFLAGVVSVLAVGILCSLVYGAYALAAIYDWNAPRPNAAFRGGREDLETQTEVPSAAAAGLPRIHVDTLMVMVLFALSRLV